MSDPLGWIGTGPLPVFELEMAAAELFADSHPRRLWSEAGMEKEANQARRAVMQLAEKLLKRTRWTLQNAPELLTDQLCNLIFGDECANTTVRLQVQDFAESVMEDAVKLFAGDRTESWKHAPEEDPDDSELEVVKKGH